MPITRTTLPLHHSTVSVRAAAGLAVVMGVFAGPLAAAVPAAQSLPAPTRPQALTAPADQAAHLVGSDSDSSVASIGTAALAAAESLADDAPGTASIDANVAHALGYIPVVDVDLGFPANPAGDCSSPVPLPVEFEPACRVHDLSYDLLRVAHREGVTIPPGLRSGLDSLLARQMRSSCHERVSCMTMAEIAHAAVHLNTERQGHGAPVEEHLPW